MHQQLAPPTESGKYAKIGTAVHLVCECFLLGTFDPYGEDWDHICKYLEREGVPPKERIALYKYLDQIAPYRGRVVALEHEFILPVIPGALPLKGHIDLIVAADDGSLMIVDHKTNRQYEGHEKWAKKIQMIAYAWALRKLMPGYSVSFQIGYVNLGTDVTWMTDPALDSYFENLFANAWQEFQVYSRREEWPERLNGNCGWCSRQGQCRTFESSMAKLLPGALQEKSSPLCSLSPTQKILWLETAIKAGTQLLDSCKKELIEQLQNSNEGKLEEEGNTASLKYSKRRQADSSLAWGRLMDILNAHPEVDEIWAECMDDVVTFKVGGLDRLAKREARFKEILDAAVEEVVGKEPTLSIMPTVGTS